MPLTAADGVELQVQDVGNSELWIRVRMVVTIVAGGDGWRRKGSSPALHSKLYSKGSNRNPRGRWSASIAVPIPKMFFAASGAKPQRAACEPCAEP